MATTAPTCVPTRGWTVRRILFLLAGTFTLVGTGLAAFVSPWFLVLPALVGANQLLMVAVGWCPMSLLLARLGVPE
ncbi:MAG TPA: DUF2892 domain-containing protein [Marmoricola sp.]